MPRRKTHFTQGHYYHVYNRGVNRQTIFFSSENYLYCLRLIQKYRQQYQISVIAYCLMPNHYHFLLRQDGDLTIDRFIGVLFNSYTQAVNRQLQRTGTLFTGRFKCIAVDDESYLRHLCRYIHANPMNAGLANSLDEWPYSNYLEWCGARAGTLVDHRFVDEFFPQREAYQAFVSSYVQGVDCLPDGLEPYLLA